MGESVKAGQKIPLSLQLSDEVTDAFVQAELFDENKVPITPAFVELVHDNQGHYVDNSVSFPATERIFAILRVWTDDPKTNRHPQHLEAIEDIFDREDSIFNCDVEIFVDQDDIVSIDVVENDTVDVNVLDEPIVEVDIIQDDIVEIDTEQSVVEILVECEG